MQEFNPSDPPVAPVPQPEPLENLDKPEILFAHYKSANLPADEPASNTKTIIVIGKHRYYNLFSAQLFACSISNAGELKAPFTALNPIDQVWRTNNPEELKFYASCLKFQSFYERSASDLEGLKALVNNPLNYTFYLHDSSLAEKVTPKAVFPVTLSQPEIILKVSVSLADELYIVTPSITIKGQTLSPEEITIRFDHFLVVEQAWFLCTNPSLRQAIQYFRQHPLLQLPVREFLRFQKGVLAKIDWFAEVTHAYLEPASAALLAESGMAKAPEKLLYLSDLENYVMLNPVMRYGDTEVPVRSRRQVYAQGWNGKLFGVERNVAEEDVFTALLVKQHPHFLEQLENPLPYFYLHKNRFLDEEWFLSAFEEWADRGITVLGFNELKGNALNQNKARVSIQISSGLNWFNADINVRYGKKKAKLKDLQKAVKNKSNYVHLDDGTIGVLPEEWLKKFEHYFASGDIKEEQLRIPKSNYAAVTELFEVRMLDEEVSNEIANLRAHLSNITAIAPAPVPQRLQATLRPYQLQGLSWLNFLDDYSLGGCLADDMGLGKTVQLLAFILLLREKHGHNTSLLVVPTSLIHSWQAEIEKFAPSLNVHIHHGAYRTDSATSFRQHELIITTYGTLVADYGILSRFVFSYVFLDESQNIKNISSQRYKAARLLKSRNKVVLTGTPLENNTFDIFAQLSFACPGLLGTRKYFKFTYAIPIDKFAHKRSARDLQNRISPFVLRRTKKEVATELPEKTEIVLHCEMSPGQREVYDRYEKEFREYISATNDEELVKNPVNVLRGITRLRQICNSPLLLKEADLSSHASAKIEVLLQQLKTITKAHKVLVFSQFVSMLSLIEAELEKEGIGSVSLTGSTRNRGAVVNRFQEEEEKRVFLVSLKAGGTGLNLTAADYVFLVDPWWNVSVENQAIDRCYRIGQQNKVMAIRLICPNTIEEKLLTMQQNKANLATDLITADQKFFSSLSKKELLSLTSS